MYDTAVRPVVESALRGFNGTVLCYGQTGAGKTYTLGSLDSEAIGMIPRALGEIFSSAAADSSHSYSLHLSYLQIYKESIQDLLVDTEGGGGDTGATNTATTGRASLQIRETQEGGVTVAGAKRIQVLSLEDALKVLKFGDKNRSVAATLMNAHSSRSHAVVEVTIVKRKGLISSAAASATVTTRRRSQYQREDAPSTTSLERVQVGKLFLVDLAGSERLKKSGSVGIRAEEARAINLSLTTLGMCVAARAEGRNVVPFRDSKLTRLLQDSLGGNAKTSMIICVSDAAEHAEESLNSLQFGSRAMRVTTSAKVNVRLDGAALREELNGGGANQLLERSLLEKESELEEIQAKLLAEQEEHAVLVESLKQEREVLAQRAAQAEVQREQQLAAERAQKSQLQARLSEMNEEVRQKQALAEENMIKAQQLMLVQQKEAANQVEQVKASMKKQLRAVEQHWEDRMSKEEQRYVALIEHLESQLGLERQRAAVAASDQEQQLVEERGEKKKLQQELTEIREQLRQQELSSLDTIKQQEARLDVQQKDAAQQVAELKAALTRQQLSADGQVGDLELRLAKLQIMADQMQSKLVTEQQYHSKLIETLQHEREMLKEKTARAEEEHNQLLALLQSENGKLKEQVFDMIGKLQQQEEESSKLLHDTNEEHNTALRLLNTQLLLQNEEEMQALKERCAQMLAEKDSAIAVYEKKQQSMHENLQNLEDKVQVLENVVSEKQEQLDSTTQDKDAVSGRLRDTTAQLEDVSSQLVAAQQALEDQKQEYQGRENALKQQMEDTKNTLQTDLENTLTSLATTTAANKQLHSQTSELAATLATAKAQLIKESQARKVAEHQGSSLLKQKEAYKARFRGAEEHAFTLVSKIECLERSRQVLIDIFVQSHRTNAAARTIQRAYRNYKIRLLHTANVQGTVALLKARQNLGDVAAKAAGLERERAANLVFDGKMLIGDCLSELQDTCETLLASFILPSKDLKALQRYRQTQALNQSRRVSGGGRGSGRFPGSNSNGNADTSVNNVAMELGIEMIEGGGGEEDIGDAYIKAVHGPFTRRRVSSSFSGASGGR